jgi:hypothetical protein
MRGAVYCSAHRHDEATASDATNTDVLHALDERRQRAEAFAEAVTRGAHGDLIERAVAAIIAGIAPGGAAPVGMSLVGEIQSLRLILSRVIAVDVLEGDPREVAQTVTRLVDTIVRAARAQQGLAGDEAGTLEALTASVLEELGLGEPR